MPEYKYQSIWQEKIPEGEPFEVELRFDSPKTIAMEKGGAFDKWGARIPRESSLHGGGEYDLEIINLCVVSNHLKDALRAIGKKGWVTITRNGEKFEVVEGRPQGVSSSNGTGKSGGGGGNGRSALPSGVTAAQHLEGLILGVYYTDVKLGRLEKDFISEDGKATAIYRAKRLEVAEKLTVSAAIVAIDSGQPFLPQVLKMISHLNKQIREEREANRAVGATRGDDPPIGEESEEGELPF